MKPDVRKVVITALCGLMIVYWARSIFGVATLASYQGAHWGLDVFSGGSEVSMIAVIIESLLLLGAALIPLVAAWRPEFRRQRWPLVLWLPCIAYALFLGINFFIHGPFTAPSTIKAVLRFATWIAIAALFIIDLRARKGQELREQVAVAGQ